MFRRFMALMAVVPLFAVAMYADPAGAGRPNPRVTSVTSSFDTTTCIITATANLADIKGTTSHVQFYAYAGSTNVRGATITIPRGATSVQGQMGISTISDTVTKVTATLIKGRRTLNTVEETVSYADTCG